MVQLVVIQVAEHQMDHHMITGLYFTTPITPQHFIGDFIETANTAKWCNSDPSVCSPKITPEFPIWKCKISPPNESVDQNILNRDQSQEDFLSHLFTNEKETNDEEKNESGKKIWTVRNFRNLTSGLWIPTYSPFLAREVGVPDYESINTADDSTLEPKPKKGTRRSRRKSCTDVKVIILIK